MFSLVEYGLGKMLVGLGTFGDKLSEFTFDTIEEEPILEYEESIEEEPKEEIEEIEIQPYKKKIDCLTYLDKYFISSAKAEGIKYYVLDKIKTYNFNLYDITGIVHDDIEHIVSIELDKSYQIKNTTCTCEKHNCKHVYALVLKYIDTELNKNKKIYYMFKTRYLLTQFRNLYNQIIDNINIEENEDLYTRIKCYDKLITNYSEKEPCDYIYKEIEGHFNSLREMLLKLNKDLYNQIIIDVEFIDHDICSDLYNELVNEDYIEDILLDNLD